MEYFFYIRFIYTFVFFDILKAQLSPSERANASQSLWFQFQKINIGQIREQLKDNRQVTNSRFSPDDILKPNTKPRFPIRLPYFGPDESDQGSEDYKTSELLSILGEHHFNENFMSIYKPKISNKNNGLYLAKTSDELQKENRRLFLRKVLKFAHLKGFRDNIDKKFRRNLRKFLGLYSLCPVKYRWKDMGSRFWPRWIQEGSCINFSQSCSYPEGMTCHEYKHRNIAILRYLCMSNWSTDRCKWYKIYIPFLLTCKCGCDA